MSDCFCVPWIGLVESLNSALLCCWLNIVTLGTEPQFQRHVSSERNMSSKTQKFKWKAELIYPSSHFYFLQFVWIYTFNIQRRQNKVYPTKELKNWHYGTINREPRWTFITLGTKGDIRCPWGVGVPTSLQQKLENGAVLTGQNNPPPPRQPIRAPQVMRAKPFFLTARASTDGQTNGQVDSSIPP